MRSIEEEIQRAMREGKFDDLPGKGKPLNLDANPHEDAEWRIAYHLLKSNDFTLPWIEKRQEIETGLEVAREALGRSWLWRQSALEQGQPRDFVEAEWQRALKLFEEKAAALNKLIFSLNLEVPSPTFQRQAIRPEREIQIICR